MTHFSTSKTTFRPVTGDCLEKAGLHIPNGGYAIIRSGFDIRVGDLVHCTTGVGAISTMVKQVKSITKDTIIVGTAYADPSRDFTFEAAEIHGVVTEVFDKLWGDRVYVRKD